MNFIDIFEGKVVKGNMIGRTLSFPTANIEVIDKTNIQFGAYISILSIDGVNYLAISNYGVHPTYESISKPIIESFILNFNKDIYGKDIVVKLLEFLRPETKFKSLDELKITLEKDKENAVNIYKEKFKQTVVSNL